MVTWERTWIRGEEEEDAPASHGGGGVELAGGIVLPLVTVTTLPLPLPTLQRENKHYISSNPTVNQHMVKQHGLQVK